MLPISIGIYTAFHLFTRVLTVTRFGTHDLRTWPKNGHLTVFLNMVDLGIKKISLTHTLGRIYGWVQKHRLVGYKLLRKLSRIWFDIKLEVSCRRSR